MIMEVLYNHSYSVFCPYPSRRDMNDLMICYFFNRKAYLIRDIKSFCALQCNMTTGGDEDAVIS
jgi:hypothetical protein